MIEKDVAKVLSVWSSQNKIARPIPNIYLSKIVDEISFLFSVGPFYYYILNFDTLVYEHVNGETMEVLGIAPEEVTVEKMFEIMHPEDMEKLHEKEAIAFDFALNWIPIEDLLLYKIAYMFRLRHADGSYRKILHQVKTISLSDDNKVQHVLGIHTDITHLNIPFHHKVSFLGRNRPSYYNMSTEGGFKPYENATGIIYTSREIEIIKELANGNNFKEIAEKLSVSPHTINTHKKNILLKSQCKNTPQLVAKCIMDGII